MKSSPQPHHRVYIEFNVHWRPRIYSFLLLLLILKYYYIALHRAIGVMYDAILNIKILVFCVNIVFDDR